MLRTHFIVLGLVVFMALPLVAQEPAVAAPVEPTAAELDQRLSTLEGRVKISGNLFSTILYDVDGETLDLAEGPTLLRLNLSYTGAAASVSSRLQLRYNAADPTDASKWLQVVWAYGSYTFGDKLAKLSVGRFFNKFDYTMFFAFAEDNVGAGAYLGKDGAEFQLRPTPELVVAGFLPVALNTAGDATDVSLGKADLNAAYTLKGLGFAHAGYLAGDGGDLGLNTAYLGVSQSLVPNLVLGLQYVNNHDAASGSLLSHAVNGTVGYTVSDFTVASDLNVTLPASGNPKVVSGSSVKYLIAKAVAPVWDLEPRLDFIWESSPDAALAPDRQTWALVPALRVVSGTNDVSLSYEAKVYAEEFAHGNPVHSDAVTHKITLALGAAF